jgi:malonyl-CoA decarboxylase
VIRIALPRLIDGVTRQGRNLLRRYAAGAFARPTGGSGSHAMRLERLAHSLLSGRGEASGVLIATELLQIYAGATTDERLAFFRLLAERFDTGATALDAAWARYKADGPSALPALAQAVEAPRQELFRRLNLAPGGTAALVGMRADLLRAARSAGGTLDAVDADLLHLLQSWFNRGFLTMRQIDWSSPASLLERMIRYEAVHHIRDWNDLRSRLDPPDRRCFAFFHPAMPDDPLIFVEVALTRGMPDAIQALLDPARAPMASADADTAVFYSISNCQPGLKGVSFGHFLIKQVASDLKRDLPDLDCFVTLSPIPGFIAWLGKSDPTLADACKSGDFDEEARASLTARAIEYFTTARTADNRPVDPVARFHLGNGARLERLNWMGDTSANGMRQSAGLMVNYLYDLANIETYHEAYANDGAVILGDPFRATMRQLTKPTARAMARNRR